MSAKRKHSQVSRQKRAVPRIGTKGRRKMLNQIVIMGRLTRDPELRYTQAQKPVASFTLAVDRDYTDESGDRPTDFVDCVAWRSTAEFVSKYFQKGSMAVVSGRLQFRDWKDREGGKRRSAEILVESVYFGASKPAQEKPDGREAPDVPAE